MLKALIYTYKIINCSENIEFTVIGLNKSTQKPPSRWPFWKLIPKKLKSKKSTKKQFLNLGADEIPWKNYKITCFWYTNSITKIQYKYLIITILQKKKTKNKCCFFVLTLFFLHFLYMFVFYRFRFAENFYLFVFTYKDSFLLTPT